jgi:metallo-beta-lactamase family protein
MKLTILGAAQEVTGSCYWTQTSTTRFLVDCGMFQGGREADIKNQVAFAFDPAALDFVLLTHAHIDHCGLLPRLVAKGFRGPIYCTTATQDLLKIMLQDAAHLQETESEWRKHHHGRKAQEQPHAPLYTMVHVEQCLKQVQGVPFDREQQPVADVRCRFRHAGHILGAASIEVWLTDAGRTCKVVFSGDIGQYDHPLIGAPAVIEDADVLLVESTYGDRLHKSMEATLAELAHAVNDTLERKRGNLIIPAFAVGRTQDILYLLAELQRQGKISARLPIYVDSPMAVTATELTLKHRELLDRESLDLLAWRAGNPHLPPIHLVTDVEESKALNGIKGGAIIISASGMCDAGRIKHHLLYNLNRSESTVVIAGFQAAGTLGRRLVDGARSVHLFGEEVAVRADIYTIGGLSAHADQANLLRWLANFRQPPRKVLVVHGESRAAQVLAGLIRGRWDTEVIVPASHGSLLLDASE